MIPRVKSVDKEKECYTKGALSDLVVSGRLPPTRQLSLAQISPSPYSVTTSAPFSWSSVASVFAPFVEPAGTEPPGVPVAWVSSG